MIKRLMCKWFGHKWDTTDKGQQPCMRCTAERLLVRATHEIIGENPYSWQIIDIDSWEDLP